MTKRNEYVMHGDYIEFKYYNLFFSSLHENKIIALDRINVIDLKTSPHSLVIDSKEIIFLNHDDTESLAAFAFKNRIPHSTHLDTWSILTREYLDTELDEKTIVEQNKQLEGVGIDRKQFRKISRNIALTMFGTMEWNYLRLWDLLAMKQHRNPFYRFYGKKYYWDTMKTALKGSRFD